MSESPNPNPFQNIDPESNFDPYNFDPWNDPTSIRRMNSRNSFNPTIILERNRLFGQQLFEMVNNDSCIDLIKSMEAEEQGAGSSSRSTSRYSGKKIVKRDRVAGNLRLMRDYFDNPPVYSDVVFRRRFRMRKELFLRIVNEVEGHDEYFQQRPNAAGHIGLTAIQKCTAAIRQLAYGAPGDSLDEYLRMSKTTATECLKRFCLAVCKVFGETYLRKPNASDIQKLYQMHEERHGFPGMLGSIDCMHWTWKNCPVAWKGQFTRGDKGKPTIMLEAVASYDLWIWHAYFGVAGSNNDLNVLFQSDVFANVLEGHAPDSSFEVNGTVYPRGYYLADGIYPEWPVFVKSFAHALDPKRLFFKKRQESARKDVERAFGVLQARWAMIRGPSQFWFQENMRDIMYSCIILHNMIIEDEGAEVHEWSADEMDDAHEAPPSIHHGPIGAFSRYMHTHNEMHSRASHHELRMDLMEHLCRNHGGAIHDV